MINFLFCGVIVFIISILVIETSFVYRTNCSMQFFPLLIMIENLSNIYQFFSLLIKIFVNKLLIRTTNISNHCILDFDIISKENNLVLIIYNKLKLIKNFQFNLEIG